MGIARYENIIVQKVTNGIDDIGQYTTTLTDWFETRGLVHDVANSLRISERYRVYADLVNINLNFTPNTRWMVDNQEQVAIVWRGFEWRVTDCRESNDRMKITFMCYRNDPEAPV